MSKNCNENYYELIGSIIVFPDKYTSFSRPFNMEKKNDKPSYSVEENRKSKLPMKKQSGVLKESVSVSVPGESYEVTVTWEIEDVNEETYDMLEGLKNETNHLIVKTFPNNDIFVRSIPEGYSFKYEESEGVLSCTFTIRNMTGAQRML